LLVVFINTPILSAGSVTVLQAPFSKTFTLDLATNTLLLTLNKGYKLQDINIISKTPAAGGTAITITHPTAGLAGVDVTCDGPEAMLLSAWRLRELAPISLGM
jgi:hypothetical protein